MPPQIWYFHSWRNRIFWESNKHYSCKVPCCSLQNKDIEKQLGNEKLNKIKLINLLFIFQAQILSSAKFDDTSKPPNNTTKRPSEDYPHHFAQRGNKSFSWSRYLTYANHLPQQHSHFMVGFHTYNHVICPFLKNKSSSNKCAPFGKHKVCPYFSYIVKDILGHISIDTTRAYIMETYIPLAII